VEKDVGRVRESRKIKNRMKERKRRRKTERARARKQGGAKCSKGVRDEGWKDRGGGRGLCGLVACARIVCRRGRCHAFDNGLKGGLDGWKEWVDVWDVDGWMDGWARGSFMNIKDMYNNNVYDIVLHIYILLGKKRGHRRHGDKTA
jgi:hypothetical protein